MVALGGLERCVVAGLLISLTRDVANAELCLGHFDCCLLEHERFVGVKSRKQLVVVGELYLKEGGD
jgi:hypothetical protein